MHSHAWLIAIFLGFFAFSSQVHGHNSDQPPAVNDDENIVEPLSIPIKIVEDQDAARQKKEELSIQRSMEKSARWAVYAAIASAFFAFASAVLVAVGTKLLGKTLNLTRQANEAAQAAVRVTREVARDQSRAYVHIDMVEIKWINFSSPSPEIRLTAVNNGQSPAKWLEVACVCIGSESDVRKPDFSEETLSSREFSRWHSFAAGGSQILEVMITEEDRYSLEREYTAYEGLDQPSISSNMTVTVYGTIRYCTIFDEICETDFFFQANHLPIYIEDINNKPDEVIESAESEQEEISAVNIPRAFREGLRAYRLIDGSI